MDKSKFSIDDDTGSIKVNDVTQFFLFHAKNEDKRRPLSQLGVWIDGDFIWLHAGEWLLKQNKHHVLSRTFTHPFLSLVIEEEEVIHPNDNVYMKKLKVKNQHSLPRDIRLFFYQNVSPNYHLGTDTAFYAPKEKVVYHFKKDACWLFNGQFAGESIKQYTTFSQMSSKPLEKHCLNIREGKLFFNPIAKGYVTSVFSLEAELLPFADKTAYYWISAATDKFAAFKHNHHVLNVGAKTAFTELKQLGYGKKMPSSKAVKSL